MSCHFNALVDGSALLTDSLNDTTTVTLLQKGAQIVNRCNGRLLAQMISKDSILELINSFCIMVVAWNWSSKHFTVESLDFQLATSKLQYLANNGALGLQSRIEYGSRSIPLQADCLSLCLCAFRHCHVARLTWSLHCGGLPSLVTSLCRSMDSTQLFLQVDVVAYSGTSVASGVM
eukprot:5016693-Amphidinium_carterae.1